MPGKRKRAGGGGGPGKRGRRDELELEQFDPSQYQMSDDEDKEIMFNQPGGLRDEDDEIDPRFAHRIEGEDIDAGLGDVDKEEEQLAVEEQKRRAALLDEDDFGLSDLMGGDDKKKKKVVKPKKRNHQADMEALEKFLSAQGATEEMEVEKDYSALTAEQKRRMLEKDSPEVLPLLKEFREKLTHASTVLAPVIEKVRKGELPTSEGVSFLDLKLQLFLSYLMHVSFYLLLKAEGKPVRNNPVVDKLVELRAYMDRLKPIEKRLQHQIQGLLARAAVSSVGPADAEETGGGRANISELAKVASAADGDGIYRAAKPLGGAPNAGERKKREARLLELHQQQQEKAEEDAMLRAPTSKKKDKQLKRAKLGGIGAVDDSVGDGALDPGLRGTLLDPKTGVMAQVRRMQAADPNHLLDADEDEEDEEEDEGDELDEFYRQEVEQRETERKQKRLASRAKAAEQPKAPKRGELKKGQAGDVVEGHRKVSKEITDNRGLTPKRNKKMKNPRVRSKYRAAKLDVKRRSQVKDVRKPSTIYQGERAIRSDVVRSHKMA
eukprot:Hpha_TRINITY_DN15029_c3_g1::TRINITY_DN15029_c3_g1_i1::g.125503::m.125503/K14767/UTP3, SAS10; U3 small nucleolar RNA-associated protein 3